MIKNYLKIAWGNLLKNKVFSLINITGLAVGLTGFIVILLYLNYELSYDKWDPSLNRLYKISAQTDEEILEQTPAPLSGFLKENLPGIEATTTMQPSGDYGVLIAAGEKILYQLGSVEADSSFFKVFPYKIIIGNPETAMDRPNAIVISKDLSNKLFGNTNPIGKVIKIFNAFENEVTAVMELPDKPSHLDVQFVWRSPYEKENNHWLNYSYQTYIKTTQPGNIAVIEAKANSSYYQSQLKKGNETLEAYRKAGHKAGLFTEAVNELHNFPKQGNSNFTTVSVLLLLALLLLIAGAINFSNLSIAASARRSKEVGIRKVLGSGRRQLIFQFMIEIAMQCIISLGLALLMVNMVLPYFNQAFNIQISFLHAANAGAIALQITICLLLVIILAGLYPSLYLSGFNIIKVLKGNNASGTQGVRFRNILIVVQFAFAAFFITGTLVIRHQMRFMQKKDKGFSDEQVMRIEAIQKTREQGFETTRNILMGIAGVQNVSKTTMVPGDKMADTSTAAFKHAGNEYRMASVKVSNDYFNTLQIPLIKGRMFNNSYADENTRSAIINETAAKKLNLKDLSGAFISFPNCDSLPIQIVGVVKDFNVAGYENTVQPVVFTVNNKACMYQSGGGILVKINGNQVKQTTAAIEQAWKKIEPDFPPRFSFLDENFQQLFSTYTRLEKIINFFTLTAIFISVMGLFALTAFLTGQRRKEISIRKVLGAGLTDLASLLSKDFVVLVVIAVSIALPVGWWAANLWLQGFAYRVSLSWWLFVTAALIIIFIAVLTVSLQTIKAAIANPVNSLRSE